MNWSIEGKTSLVTGSNTGIGKATALELARRGSYVVLACRSEARAAPVVEAIRRESGEDRAEFLKLDLSSLAAVAEAAAVFAGGGRPLHVLVNNAGTAGRRGSTAEGFELTFGVNYLGHYLFTRLLLESLAAAAPARIVNVASAVHHRARRIDWDRLSRRPAIAAVGEYAVSKLANVLFSRELAARLRGTGITTYAVHPGPAASDIYRVVPQPFRRLMTRSMPTPAKAARTQVWCATDPELAGETGLYYADLAPRGPSAAALDDRLAAELWERSEAWVADYL